VTLIETLVHFLRDWIELYPHNWPASRGSSKISYVWILIFIINTFLILHDRGLSRLLCRTKHLLVKVLQFADSIRPKDIWLHFLVLYRAPSIVVYQVGVYASNYRVKNTNCRGQVSKVQEKTVGEQDSLKSYRKNDFEQL
jgi:hypothetical protein